MYENIDKTQYTPMMRQYLEIKEQYKDALVFFRLGDFYEMFFNDAIVASRELEIVLTGRDAGVNNDRVPMCGVPHHSVNTYIEKLSQKGYKVAIVEQLEEPGQKKIVHRDVIRIITPGTNIDETYLNDKSNNYIGGLEKIDDNYYFSYVDLSTGDSLITKFPNHVELVFSEINKLGIKEIVTSSHLNINVRNQLNKIYGVLISLNDDAEIDNYLLNLVEGLDEFSQTATKRLLSYIIKTQKRVLVHLKPFSFYDNKEYLRLDNNAVRNLELVESLHGNRFKNNLFSILDKCSTAMGSRFLKKSILFPLVDLNQINERHTFIDELHKKYIVTQELKKSLSEVYDLERIIGRISFGTLSPKDLLQLKKSLGVLPNVKAKLLELSGAVSKKYSDSIYLFTDLYTELDAALNEDAPYVLKDGGVIKSGYNEDLDKIRNVESSNKEFLLNLEQRERERTGIKGLKVGYNRVFGYYIEVTKSYLPLVKDEFGYIRKQTTSNSERYITEELKEREALILRSSELALSLEIELFNNLRNKCKDQTAEIQKLATIISKIDMLISLSIVAKENNYTRPTFSRYNELIIKDGRHPVIEAVSEKEFIPNDTILYNDEKVLIITGPNMSGKSTFMRQNALISILAQIGSFVPAKSAKLPIYDQIFTRIGSSDDIASGESTFMTEMLEVNYALQNATSESLIILDEVGRGTATFDGMALAQAIIEYIHDNIGAKTFFSTHYHELTSLDKSLPFLRNVHVEANADDFDETGELIFLHKVLPGPTDQSYGINVASLAKIPLKITLRANDILTKLESKTSYDSELLSKNNYTEPIIISELDPKDKSILDELKGLDVDSMKPLDALILLNKWKAKVDE